MGPLNLTRHSAYSRQPGDQMNSIAQVGRRSQDVIDVYAVPMPSGWKVVMALEESELKCTVHTVDPAAGEQHAPDFVAVNSQAHKRNLRSRRKHDTGQRFRYGVPAMSSNRSKLRLR